MLCNYWFMHLLPEDRSFSSFYFEDVLILIDTSSLSEIIKTIARKL